MPFVTVLVLVLVQTVLPSIRLTQSQFYTISNTYPPTNNNLTFDTSPTYIPPAIIPYTHPDLLHHTSASIHESL
jgi:hypothetical protein